MSINEQKPFTLVVVTAGTSDPSSTRMLADRTAQRVAAGLRVLHGETVELEPGAKKTADLNLVVDDENPDRPAIGSAECGTVHGCSRAGEGAADAHGDRYSTPPVCPV